MEENLPTIGGTLPDGAAASEFSEDVFKLGRGGESGFHFLKPRFKRGHAQSIARDGASGNQGGCDAERCWLESRLRLLHDGAQSVGVLRRQGFLFHLAVADDVDGFALGEKRGLDAAVLLAPDAVGEFDDEAAQDGGPGLDEDLIVVAGRGAVSAVGLDDW